MQNHRDDWASHDGLYAWKWGTIVHLCSWSLPQWEVITLIIKTSPNEKKSLIASKHSPMRSNHSYHRNIHNDDVDQVRSLPVQCDNTWLLSAIRHRHLPSHWWTKNNKLTLLTHFHWLEHSNLVQASPSGGVLLVLALAVCPPIARFTFIPIWWYLQFEKFTNISIWSNPHSKRNY